MTENLSESQLGQSLGPSFCLKLLQSSEKMGINNVEGIFHGQDVLLSVIECIGSVRNDRGGLFEWFPIIILDLISSKIIKELTFRGLVVGDQTTCSQSFSYMNYKLTTTVMLFDLFLSVVKSSSRNYNSQTEGSTISLRCKQERCTRFRSFRVVSCLFDREFALTILPPDFANIGRECRNSRLRALSFTTPCQCLGQDP